MEDVPSDTEKHEYYETLEKSNVTLEKKKQISRGRGRKTSRNHKSPETRANSKRRGDRKRKKTRRN